MKNAGLFTKGCKHLVTHGRSKEPIYRIWRAMLTRCRNPNSRAYLNYGGRGIDVCPRWEVFANFYSDMGDRPQGMSLDRIDNDLGYSPKNCRWADRRTQNLNVRGRRQITANGRTMHIVEWADETGLSVSTIWARLAKGWPEGKAVTTPKATKRKGIPRGNHLYDGAEHGVVWTEPERIAA